MLISSAPGPYPPSWPPQEPANFGDWAWTSIANSWEWVGSQQAVLVALAAVVTAIIAIFALRSTASDSRERSRPIVLAFFRKSPHNESAFDLVVHNYGTSAASDIDVEFDPPFTAEQRNDHMVKALAQRYDKPVPLMPPGAEITNVWWALDFSAPNGSGSNRYPTPDEALVSITYTGNRRRRYEEKINLDTSWMKGDTSTVSSASRPGLHKQNTTSLKKIADESRASRLLLRDIADGMSEGQLPPPAINDLSEMIQASGSDMTALAAHLGVSEKVAAEIVAVVESDPITGNIDVVSNGQIEPGSASGSL